MTQSATPAPTNIPYLGIPEQNPRDTFYRRRGPTPKDFTSYAVGDRWIDRSANQAWILVSKANGIATWQFMSGGGGAINTLQLQPPVASNFNFTNSGAVNIVGAPGAISLGVNVDGVTISIIGNQLVAGGSVPTQFDPDIGANVSPVASILQVPGLGGNQTLNGGAGILQFNNRRWSSQFVVDPSAVTGSDAEYTTIQAAITAASAAGGGTVIVRHGTYIENLTFAAGVDVVAVGGDGRPVPGQVTVLGNHTMTSAGFSVLSGIGFSAAAGDVFTLTAAGPGVSVLALKFCNVDSPTGRVSVTSAAGGAFGLMVFFDSQISSQLVTCEVGNSSAVNFQESTAASATAACVNLSGSSSSSTVFLSNLGGSTAAVIIGNVAAQLLASYSQLSGGTNASVLFAAAGTATMSHNTYTSNNPTTFYIDGAAGTYAFGDDVMQGGSATAINPALSTFSFQWRPRGTAGLTGATAFAGTASFNSGDFTVVDGFVSLVSGATTGSVTTIGAVTGDVITFPLGVTPGMWTFVAISSGFDSATPSAGGYEVIGSARTDGVTATIVGVPDTTDNEDPAFNAADIDIIASGNNAILRVTGVAGLTINWTAQMRSQFAS